MYEVFAFNPHIYLRSYGNPLLDPRNYVCCFSNDMRLCCVVADQRFVVAIDLDTGSILREIWINDKLLSSNVAAKLFCARTYAILITPNNIGIFDLNSWKRVECSYPLHLTDVMLFHSKLSPLRNVVALPGHVMVT